MELSPTFNLKWVWIAFEMLLKYLENIYISKCFKMFGICERLDCWYFWGKLNIYALPPKMNVKTFILFIY